MAQAFTTELQIFFGVAKAFGAITDILATGALCAFLTSAKTGMRQFALPPRLLSDLHPYLKYSGPMGSLIR
jgi:hypothetical protein